MTKISSQLRKIIHLDHNIASLTKKTFDYEEIKKIYINFVFKMFWGQKIKLFRDANCDLSSSFGTG